MAREIITKIWCDPCIDAGDMVEGEETAPLSYGNKKPRVMALCERHRKELLDPLVLALDEYGEIITDDSEAGPRKTRHRSDEERQFDCKVPGCEGYGPYLHEASLRSHVHSQHKLTWAQYLGNAMDEPSLLDEDFEIPDEFKCGEEGCDAEFDPRNYKSQARCRQALTQHRRQAHGINVAKAS